MAARHEAAALLRFSTEACLAAGLEAEKAQAVAEVLVEGDLMGHDTHGLALLLPYLDSLAAGEMLPAGEPEVISATPVAETWASPSSSWSRCWSSPPRARGTRSCCWPSTSR